MPASGARGRGSADRAASRREAPADPGPRTIEKARQRDIGAFERIYHAYVGRVYAVCLRLTGDPGRAEDVTQDVFLRLWRKIDSYEGRSSFYSWLYRLTVNLVADTMRSELRRATREQTHEDPDRRSRPRPLPTPDAGIDLEAAIASLPLAARVTFVLHDVEGYRHEEIAEFTGVAVGTSKAQLHRARRLLREMLSR